MTRSKHRTRALLAISATSLLVLAACGSDGADSTASTANTTAATTAETDTPAATEAPAGDRGSRCDRRHRRDGCACATDAMSTDFDLDAACQSWIDADTAVIQFLFTGQGDADSVNASLDAAVEAADPAIEQTIVDLTAAAQPQLADPESDGSDETLALYADATAWAGATCPDVEAIDVTAVDYHYEGIPDELSTGYKVINFTNGGTEAHEIFTFKINDGVTEPVEELLDLPEDQAMTKITPVNVGFAMPGTTSAVSWDLTDPGNYASVCFVSVGSVDGAEGEGPPHFTQGMIHEFTVN